MRHQHACIVRRLFIIPVNLRQWYGYFLDLMFLLFLWGVWLSVPSLLEFGREPVVALFPPLPRLLLLLLPFPPLVMAIETIKIKNGSN